MIVAIDATWLILLLDGSALCYVIVIYKHFINTRALIRPAVPFLQKAKLYSMRSRLQTSVSKIAFNIKYLPGLFIFCAVQHSIAKDRSPASVLPKAAGFLGLWPPKIHLHLNNSNLMFLCSRHDCISQLNIDKKKCCSSAFWNWKGS